MLVYPDKFLEIELLCQKMQACGDLAQWHKLAVMSSIPAHTQKKRCRLLKTVYRVSCVCYFCGKGVCSFNPILAKALIFILCLFFGTRD